MTEVFRLVQAAQAFVLDPTSVQKKLQLEAAAWGPLAAPPAPAAVAVPTHTCCNSWFMSLSEGRQSVLRDDKWMLAHAAFDAGRAALAAAPAQEHATQLAGQGLAIMGKSHISPAAPAQAQEDAQDPVRALIAAHAEMLEDNAYAYFELAYTRQTGWMAWITDKPGWCKEVLVNPDRKVLARGQGGTPDEACADAARAAQGGAQ